MPVGRFLAGAALSLHILLVTVHLNIDLVYAWHICTQQAVYPGHYGQDAALALARHRTHILKHVWQSFKPDGHPWGHEAYKPFQPYIRCPSGPAQRYGQAGMDGSKLLCPLRGLSKNKDCVVVSLGSNGNYQFEQAILNATRCQVHTLDCTYPGRSLDPARHSYHKVCIGSSSSSSPGFSSWQQATRLWGGKPVAVLKVDIEGHESPLLAELEPGDHLPQQLVIEMHITARHPHTGRGFPLVTGPAPRDQAQAAVLFMHLAALGYAIVAAEPNAGSPCCAEFTFLRVETARPLRLDRGGLALPTGHGG